ncbi:hypothetical protein FE236_00405 [Mariprofundus erugo]|uniref:hypothetical protein n=1 Tax=Mariprofundus erugo TaxID=2528639 RepID=UPI0010FD2F36|nr:hypothetical protein [Mariprofundus erugo]TLS78255.1 hypothetical protein FE236_00405 [Mariprofundus erugo]
MIEYRTRLSILEPEKIFTVSSEMLTWQSTDGSRGSLAYGDIRLVQLKFDPTRVVPDRYSMFITSRRNGQTIRINSHSYRGLGDFEDHRDEYRHFCLQLLAAIGKANPDTLFTGGISATRHRLYWLLLLFVLAGLVGAILFFFAIGIVWIALAKVLLILWLLPSARRFMQRNKPVQFTADAIPPALLPPGNDRPPQ